METPEMLNFQARMYQNLNNDILGKHQSLNPYQKFHIQSNSLYETTGGPPLTRKSLTRFPVTRFFAYVRVSGGISVSRGPQYSPTNTSFM